MSWKLGVQVPLFAGKQPPLLYAVFSAGERGSARARGTLRGTRHAAAEGGREQAQPSCLTAWRRQEGKGSTGRWCEGETCPAYWYLGYRRPSSSDGFDEDHARGRVATHSQKPLNHWPLPREGAAFVPLLVAPTENESGMRAGTPGCHPPEDKSSSSSMAQHILGVKRNFPNYNHIWFCICRGRGRHPSFSL